MIWFSKKTASSPPQKKHQSDDQLVITNTDHSRKIIAIFLISLNTIRLQEYPKQQQHQYQQQQLQLLQQLKIIMPLGDHQQTSIDTKNQPRQLEVGLIKWVNV